MNKLELQNYNLEYTLFSGQTFSWVKKDDYFIGTTNSHVLKLRQEEDTLFWQTYPNKDDFEYLKNYLRLDEDYESILNKINKDENINKAILHYKNLRILKQGLELALFSFILSQNKNIPAIKKTYYVLSNNFKKGVNVDGETYYLFPSAEEIFYASDDKFIGSGMGYRFQYFKKASEEIVKLNLEERIKGKDESEVRAELKKIYGVGDKVADCVLVFGLGFDSITPIDRWGFRIVEDMYNMKNQKYESVREWFRNYFEGHAAWAGQFLFEYMRNNYFVS